MYTGVYRGKLPLPLFYGVLRLFYALFFTPFLTVLRRFLMFYAVFIFYCVSRYVFLLRKPLLMFYY